MSPNSVFQLVRYAGSLEPRLLDVAFVLADEPLRPVNTGFQVQVLALLRTKPEPFVEISPPRSGEYRIAEAGRQGVEPLII